MTYSLAQAVAHVLAAADQPLTVDEILGHVEQLPLAASAPGRTNIRNALGGLFLAASLGGRPARYVWWPRLVDGSTFRLPLTGADPAVGPWPLGEDAFLALWPTFFAERQPAPYAVTLALPGESLVDAQVGFVRPGPGAWALFPGPALMAWLQREGVMPGAALIVRGCDAANRRYAVTLAQPEQRDETALAARNRALVEMAVAALAARATTCPTSISSRG